MKELASTSHQTLDAAQKRLLSEIVLHSPKPLWIYWFRSDLRIAHSNAFHEALSEAKKRSALLLPLYVDEEPPRKEVLGARAKLWLQESLKSLSSSLQGALIELSCCSVALFQFLLELQEKACRILGVSWNSEYTQWQRERDHLISSLLQRAGIEVRRHHGNLLIKPGTLLKACGGPHYSFSHFFKKLCSLPLKRLVEEETEHPTLCWREPLSSKSLFSSTQEELRALNKKEPQEPAKSDQCLEITAGERRAQERLRSLRTTIAQTPSSALTNASSISPESAFLRLSPHLRFGEIAPKQMWSLFADLAPTSQVAAHLLKELAQREFSYHLLFHHPSIRTNPLKKRFRHFPWLRVRRDFKAWTGAATGIPIVDAAMRQLSQKGLIHPRAQLIASSFLSKNLLIDWRKGEEWFQNHLLDADPAIHPRHWQWVAGCAQDSLPFGRILSPELQAARFDPQGHYIHRYVPELAKLAPPFLFAPWKAPKKVLKEAQIALGYHYPWPICDLKASKEMASMAHRFLQEAQEESSMEAS